MKNRNIHILIPAAQNIHGREPPPFLPTDHVFFTCVQYTYVRHAWSSQICSWLSHAYSRHAFLEYVSRNTHLRNAQSIHCSSSVETKILAISFVFRPAFVQSLPAIEQTRIIHQNVRFLPLYKAVLFDFSLFRRIGNTQTKLSHF